MTKILKAWGAEHVAWKEMSQMSKQFKTIVTIVDVVTPICISAGNRNFLHTFSPSHLHTFSPSHFLPFALFIPVDKLIVDY